MNDPNDLLENIHESSMDDPNDLLANISSVPVKPTSISDQYKDWLSSKGFVDPAQQITMKQGANVSPIQRQVLQNVLLTLGLPEFALGKPIYNALARIGSGTAIGTGVNALSPENKQDLGQSALENLGLNTALEAIPPVLKASLGVGKSLISPFMALPEAKSLMNYLGNGATTIKENAMNFAKGLKSAKENAINYAKEAYDPVFEKYGTAPIKTSEYDIPEDLKKEIYSPNLKKLHDKFIDEPTLDNAHKLQSDLGRSIRKFQKMDTRNQLSFADRGVMENQEIVRDALNKDIDLNLSNLDENAANLYKEGNARYAEHVAPYLEYPGISEIASKKGIKNPQNFHTSFASPEPEIEKIVNDMESLGIPAKNMILFNKIGGYDVKLTPQVLANKLSDMRGKDFESYFTPELEQYLGSLNKKISRGDKLKTAEKFTTLGISPLIRSIVSGEKYIKPQEQSTNALRDIMGQIYRATGRGAAPLINQEIDDRNSDNDLLK